MKRLLFISTVFLGLSVISGTAAMASYYTGVATAYGPLIDYGAGACLYPVTGYGPYTWPKSNYPDVVALNTRADGSTEDWGYRDGENCGRYIQVTNTRTNQTVIAQVADRCGDNGKWCGQAAYMEPSGKYHIDLSNDTAKKIGIDQDGGSAVSSHEVTWEYLTDFSQIPANPNFPDIYKSTIVVHPGNVNQVYVTSPISGGGQHASV